MKFINYFKAFSNTFIGGIFLIISMGYFSLWFILDYLFKPELSVYYSSFIELSIILKILISFVFGIFLVIISVGILTLINNFKTEFILNLKK